MKQLSLIKRHQSLLIFFGLGIFTCAAYANSLAVPMLFDDEVGILENLRLRHLWPLAPLLTGSMRPLTELTFALNYAWGGFAVRGFHLANLVIHLITGGVLYGVLRRTFRSARLSATFGSAAEALAGAAALLWLVHPLNTNAVTYISQRAEVLMALCYLLALYSLIRSMQSMTPSRWEWLAIVSCAAGMASKPVMVTAPLLLLAYDRVFLASGWRDIRRRWRFYAALALTWVLLGLLLTHMVEVTSPNVGFHYAAVTPGQYIWTECSVVWRYLRLAFWPAPLVFDYGWPWAQPLREQWGSVLLMAGLVLGTGALLVKKPAIGFAGLWVLGILAPTSSVLPIEDAAAEYRMYLPLTGLLAATVALAWLRLRRLSWGRGRLVALGLAGAVGVALALATWQRNQIYRSAETLWADVVAKRPSHARGYVNLGVAWLGQGRVESAGEVLQHALRLNPQDSAAHNGWAQVLAAQGRLGEAVLEYREAMQTAPALTPTILYNMANVFAQQAQYDEALVRYAAAVRLQPSFADAQNNWGNVLLLLGRSEDAATHYLAALQADPHHAKAARNLQLARAALPVSSEGP